MTRSIFIAAALALAATLPAAQAQAQAPRTFVSAAGSDSNPCSFAAPCRHFQAAVDATSAGGEVDALDPAGYGPIIISQAITINANSTDKIALIGLEIDGANAANNGVQFSSGGSLNIRDSVIRNFTQDGINFTPNSASQISVANTEISDNGADGIQVSAPSILVHGLFSHVDLENNGQSGLDVSAAQGGTAKVTISDGVSSTNATGISASSGSGSTIVTVRNCTIANNTNSGLAASTSGVIRVTRSTITGNGSGWTNSVGGQVTSYGDNNIDDNTNVNTEPPNPLVYH